MADLHKEYVEDCNAVGFEQVAHRLLGDRYLELKALNATAAQIFNEFGQFYFNGSLIETPGNRDDITLFLIVSRNIYAAGGSLR